MKDHKFIQNSLEWKKEMKFFFQSTPSFLFLHQTFNLFIEISEKRFRLNTKIYLYFVREGINDLKFFVIQFPQFFSEIVK